MFTLSFHSILQAERSAYDFQRRNKPRAHANRNHSSTLREINRNFYPVWDISGFTLSFHSILHAKRSARVFQRRNKPRAQANRNHSSILSKIKRYFSRVWDNSMFKRSFHSILHPKRIARVFYRRIKPIHTQIAIIRRFWRRLSFISLLFEIIPRLNATFTPFFM